ncbi:MAG: stage III sporulation protein AG [Herbinix sp.]|nr:stage III sporulation protein AG [Herbinix sp.]
MEKKKISLKEIGLPKLIMIFIAGILIILLSFPGIFNSKDSKENSTQDNNSDIQQNDTNTTSYDTNTYISKMENKLKSILKKVSGIGEVEVMITLKASEEQVTLKDTPSTQKSLNEVDGEGGSRTESSVTREESTVLYTDENGNSVPYIIQEIEPEVEGVVVIAEGGDNANIIMDIMEAAEVLFDVPAHKVKVMKMENRIN